MKNFVVMCSLLCASLAFADLKLTVFERNSSDNTDRGALVCGVVTPIPTQLAPVFVTTDNNSLYESQYTTFTNRQGNFCVVVSTYLGRVEAIVENEKAESKLVK